MAKSTDNSLLRLEQPPRDVVVPIFGALVVLCLLIGFVYAFRNQEWTAAGIFAGSVVLFGLAAVISSSRNKRLLAAADRRYISWDSASPELQRQNVIIEVRELARLLHVESDQMTDLLSAYVVAEDLAMRQIQQEENLPMMRHFSIGQTPFDAILLEQDTIICVEVAFLVTPDIRDEKIESMLKKVSLAKKNLTEMKVRLRLKLMLVLVTQLTQDEEDHLRGMLVTKRFSETPVDIDIRMLDFETLQKVYISD